LILVKRRNRKDGTIFHITAMRNLPVGEMP
jgi:hypothetical protein